MEIQHDKTLLEYSIKKRLPRELFYDYFNTNRISINKDRVVYVGDKKDTKKFFTNVDQLYIEKVKDIEDGYSFWLIGDFEYYNIGKDKLPSSYMSQIENNINNEELWKVWLKVLKDNDSVFIFLYYKIIKYINWKKNRNSYYVSSHLGDDVDIHCQINGKNVFYHYAPYYLSVSEIYKLTYETDDIIESDFDDMFNHIENDRNIILIRELQKEASQLHTVGSHRSAYLIAYLSLEIATKELIRACKPDTDYLITEGQLLPLTKLYSQFIDVSIVKIIDDYKILQGVVELRNKIAHKGKEVSSMEFLQDFQYISSWINKIEAHLVKFY